MSREKQKLECEMAEMLEIIEKAREIYANDITDHTENEYIREGLLDAGYRKQSEIIRCKDCNYFREYSSEYARTTEGADGDCHIRIMNSNNEQYFACQYDDFCSFAKMKGGAE